MTALDHITAGRTVLRALLIAVVVTAGIASAAGTVAAEPMDGKGDDPFPVGVYLSLDGKGNDPFPLSFTSGSWTDIIDGTGNDVVSLADQRSRFTVTSESSTAMLAFPINNVTRLSTQTIAVVLPQDMDPY